MPEACDDSTSAPVRRDASRFVLFEASAELARAWSLRRGVDGPLQGVEVRSCQSCVRSCSSSVEAIVDVADGALMLCRKRLPACAISRASGWHGTFCAGASNRRPTFGPHAFMPS